MSLLQEILKLSHLSKTEWVEQISKLVDASVCRLIWATYVATPTINRGDIRSYSAEGSAILDKLCSLGLYTNEGCFTKNLPGALSIKSSYILYKIHPDIVKMWKRWDDIEDQIQIEVNKFYSKGNIRD